MINGVKLKNLRSSDSHLCEAGPFFHRDVNQIYLVGWSLVVTCGNVKSSRDCFCTEMFLGKADSQVDLFLQQVEVKNGEQGGDGGQSINPISRLIQIQQVRKDSTEFLFMTLEKFTTKS